MKITKLIIALVLGLVFTLNTSYGHSVVSDLAVDETQTLEVNPLKLYWGIKRTDYFNLATAVAEERAKTAAYGEVRIQGYLLKNWKPGTKPLKLYWHAARMDHYTAITTAGIQHANSINYKYMGNQGYLYTKQVSGTKPLKLYYHSGRKDHCSVVTAKGELAVKAAGYKFVRIQGYVLTEVKTPTSSSKLDIVKAPTYKINEDGTMSFTFQFNQFPDASSLKPGQTILLNSGNSTPINGTIKWAGEGKIANPNFPPTATYIFTTTLRWNQWCAFNPDCAFTLTLVGKNTGFGVIKTSRGVPLQGNSASGNYVTAFFIIS